jgi:hypothetical protein
VKPAIVRGEGEQHVVLLRGEVAYVKDAKIEDSSAAFAEAAAIMSSTSTMARRP